MVVNGTTTAIGLDPPRVWFDPPHLTGLVVVSREPGGRLHVLADLSARYDLEGWSTATAAARLTHGARWVAVEAFCAEMVESHLRALDPDVPVRVVRTRSAPYRTAELPHDLDLRSFPELRREAEVPSARTSRFDALLCALEALHREPALSVGSGFHMTHRYDEDCWLPPSYSGWSCPFGHLNYQIHCWGCRY